MLDGKPGKVGLGSVCARAALSCGALSYAALFCAALSCSSEGSGARPLPAITQAELDALGQSLRFGLDVLENTPDDCVPGARFSLCHEARIVLENTGPARQASGFSLYFNHMGRVLRGGSAQFRIRHENGGLQRITPTEAFRGFGAGETFAVPFQAENCMTAESLALPRAYLAAPGLTPVVIANTDGEDPSAWLAPLATPAETRCASDVAPLWTSASRFERNESLRDLGPESVAAEIVPRPLAVELGSGALDLSRGLDLRAPGLAEATVAAVRERLERLGVSAGSDPIAVEVAVDPDHAAFAERASAEAYRMLVAPDRVEVVGADRAGAFHGLMSLVALVPAPGAARWVIPALEIPYDAPRYRYRGLLVDVARNFHGLDVLSSVLEQMAAYKLNALHLSLSNDEGFRLEIPGLPELTEVGARRCHDEAGGCLAPQLGSGPFADANTGSGHLSREDFVTLLARAAALHIEVIPELNGPGHSHAAIVAMEARRAAGDETYALRHPEDASEYVGVQAYTDNVMDGCLESTYAFVAKLMDEIAAMYADAGVSLGTWHMGGDEVPSGPWTRSPACQALFASGGPVREASDVRFEYARRVAALARERGLELRAWADVLYETPEGGPPVFLDPSVEFPEVRMSTNAWPILQYYDDSPGRLAALGYDIVYTSPDHLFLDHPQDADPKSPGLAWAARSTDTRRVFGYITGNLAANAPFVPECVEGRCAPWLEAATPLADQSRVIGVQGQLWGELLRTPERVEEMLFPRLLALAERAWHRAAWEPPDGMDLTAMVDRDALDADWSRFASTLGHKELPKLERLGIRFHVEVPGARNAEGRLELNVGLPGFRLEYRDEGGAFVAYDPESPLAFRATEIRAVSAMGRAGRAIGVP